MKKNSALEILIWAMVAVPFLYLAAIYGQLPAEVPTHFDANGQPDDYSPKSNLLVILLMLSVPTNFLIMFLPSIDPKRNFDQFPGAFQRFRLVIALALAALGGMIIYASTHAGFNPLRALSVIMGGLFAGMGNYLGSVKPNYFVGIRTPWTLENETVWRKTHRVGARWFFIAGLATMLLGLVLPIELVFWAILVPMLGACLGTVWYSWHVFQQEKKAA